MARELPSGKHKLDTLRKALADGMKRPYIGVTQGGSSRKNAGARPAATKGEWRPTKWREVDYG